MIYSQRVTPPGRVRWIDRVLGVAVGALVTAWFLRRAPEAVVVADASDPAVAPTSAVRPAPEPIPVAVAAATTRAPEATARSSGPEAPSPPRMAEVVTAPREREAATASRQPATSPPEAASAGEPPPLPLPRMPGDTRLSSSARFDAASESWVLKAAFRVHARDHHVLAFYRKALADQGLAVTQSEDPPTADGAVKTYLHGKSARVHAQVGILPRTDALETRVWILWRSRG